MCRREGECSEDSNLLSRYPLLIYLLRLYQYLMCTIQMPLMSQETVHGHAWMGICMAAMDYSWQPSCSNWSPGSLPHTKMHLPHTKMHYAPQQLSSYCLLARRESMLVLTTCTKHVCNTYALSGSTLSCGASPQLVRCPFSQACRHWLRCHAKDFFLFTSINGSLTQEKLLITWGWQQLLTCPAFQSINILMIEWLVIHTFA